MAPNAGASTSGTSPGSFIQNGAGQPRPSRPVLIVWDVENCRLSDNATVAEVVKVVKAFNARQAELQGLERPIKQFVAARTLLLGLDKAREVEALKNAGINFHEVRGKQAGKVHDADLVLRKARYTIFAVSCSRHS
jgi:hypothetical protein